MLLAGSVRTPFFSTRQSHVKCAQNKNQKNENSSVQKHSVIHKRDQSEEFFIKTFFGSFLSCSICVLPFIEWVFSLLDVKFGYQFIWSKRLWIDDEMLLKLLLDSILLWARACVSVLHRYQFNESFRQPKRPNGKNVEWRTTTHFDDTEINANTLCKCYVNIILLSLEPFICFRCRSTIRTFSCRNVLQPRDKSIAEAYARQKRYSKREKQWH